MLKFCRPNALLLCGGFANHQIHLIRSKSFYNEKLMQFKLRLFDYFHYFILILILI